MRKYIYLAIFTSGLIIANTSKADTSPQWDADNYKLHSGTLYKQNNRFYAHHVARVFSAKRNCAGKVDSNKCVSFIMMMHSINDQDIASERAYNESQHMVWR